MGGTGTCTETARQSINVCRLPIPATFQIMNLAEVGSTDDGGNEETMPLSTKALCTISRIEVISIVVKLSSFAPEGRI